MAAGRWRPCNALSHHKKALGYGSDIGYNSFLYSNESSARQLLMWWVCALRRCACAVADAFLTGQAD